LKKRCWGKELDLTGGCRELYNEKGKAGQACSTYERFSYNTLLGKPEGQRLLGEEICVDGRIVLEGILGR
jgi:hypothetical protein